MAIDKAVILAAGRGNRISGVSRTTPKPLLPLDGAAGECFLDYHLRALSALGVREIYLVGNQVTYGTRLASMADVAATWILNPTEDLSTSGSGHSAQFAWKSPHNILDGASRVVLMDADIVYDTRLLSLLADSPVGRSKSLVCSDFRETDEEVMVFGEGADAALPRLHGKGLLGTPLVAGYRCLGEATGILLWEASDHRALSSVTDWLIRFSTAKARSEHEDITQRMMTMGRVEAVTFSESDYLFMEVDTPEEYRVLVEEVSPKLLRR